MLCTNLSIDLYFTWKHPISKFWRQLRDEREFYLNFYFRAEWPISDAVDDFCASHESKQNRACADERELTAQKRTTVRLQSPEEIYLANCNRISLVCEML